MIDIDTYKKLHPESAMVLEMSYRFKSDIEPEAMESDEPPTGNRLLLFPSKIRGFNLRMKKWGMIPANNRNYSQTNVAG